MNITQFLNDVGENQTRISTELDEIIKKYVNDPKIAQLISNITNYSNLLMKKIQNSNRSEEDKNKALRIFKRLFKKIPSREIGGKGDIMVPLNDVRMNLHSMLFLSTFGIEIGHIPFKNLDGYSVETVVVEKNSSDLDKRYCVKLYQDLNGKKTFIKEIPSKRWKSFVFTFRLLDTTIDKNYIQLHDALQEIYKGETQEQWIADTQKLADEIAQICKQSSNNLRDYGNLGSSALNKDLFPIPNKTIFDQNSVIAGKKMFDETTELVIQMQRDGELPSIFNPNSLKDINRTQIVGLLLDGSNSTHFRNAFKLLNIATNQASRYIKSILGDKVKIFIFPYTRNINGIYNSLDGFILPGLNGGGTNTHVGIRAGLEFFIRFNEKIQNGEEVDVEEFMEIVKMFNDYFPEDIGASSPYLSNEVIIPKENTLTRSILASIYGEAEEYPDWDVSSTIDPKYFDPLAFNNCHLIPLTDGLPNWRKKTVNIAKPVKKMGVGFSQLVVGYDLKDMDQTIAGELLTTLGGGDMIKDMPDYIQRFEEVSRNAGGNSFVVWLNEAVAHSIVSMFDVSLGINQFNLINGLTDA